MRPLTREEIYLASTDETLVERIFDVFCEDPLLLQELDGRFLIVTWWRSMDDRVLAKRKLEEKFPGVLQFG